ncbi:PDR/VanB family oxidoreductase [Pseudonocardia xishanensis]|uniref:PDR/VanB family oxidoreductase n=1 Tax=Pseudonocardia xishanensis TaxID=630995 RepID=A0ABP8S277_9PSEU
MTDDLLLRVVGRRAVADRVVELDLSADGDAALPAWTPGAHIDLVLAEGLVRQYSLCGDPGDTARWRVAVLHQQEGRGGSARVHELLHPGETVLVRGPRNHFALEPAARLLFLAGGIGITPLLPMIAAADRAGADWELHYGGRTETSMAYLDDLRRRFPERVRARVEATDGLLDLDAVLGTPRSDTLVYCCGPEALLTAVEQRCAGWPAGALRTERFAASAPSGESTAFEVEFAQSGVTATVPAGRSIVEVAEDHAIPVITSCEEGVCGTCESRCSAADRTIATAC